MKILGRLALWCATLALVPLLEAQEAPSESPSPPTQVEALDVPNDSGHAIEVRWTDSSDPRGVLL